MIVSIGLRQAIGPAATLVASFGIAGIKYALDRLGYKGGAPRAPLLPVNEAARKEIDSSLSSATSSAAD